MQYLILKQSTVLQVNLSFAPCAFHSTKIDLTSPDDLSTDNNHDHKHQYQPPIQPAKMPSIRRKQNPEFKARVDRLRLPLAPLVEVVDCKIHPAFPKSVLHYYLLTDQELEDLAHFYHQRTPSYWTAQYHFPMRWRAGLTTNEKRRKFGRFIGLRGCETPKIQSSATVKTEEELEAELWEEARRERLASDQRKRKWSY